MHVPDPYSIYLEGVRSEAQTPDLTELGYGVIEDHTVETESYTC
jgi:hypothetical protein